MTKALHGVVAHFGDALARAAHRLEPRFTFDAHAAMHRQTAPPLSSPGRWSPNRHCRLVRAADGWLAVNLARADDVRSVPAWTGCALGAEPWTAVRDFCADRPTSALLESAVLLGLPVAIVGERTAADPVTASSERRAHWTLRAFDLSALWAGPLCGSLLARCGIEVTKIESPGRPDPMRRDAALNGAKRHLTLPLDSSEAKALIAQADILITNSRAAALARLGLSPDTLFALNPTLIWVAITAHGFVGPGAQRVGFGDDCAAAGGLVAWRDDAPRFLGDALADPLTGIAAATAALDAVAGARGGLIDISLAGTAALAARVFHG
jgi:hypothetical protein